MKKVWKFFTEPPRWWVETWFWISVLMVVLSAVALVFAVKLPGIEQDPRKLMLALVWNAATACFWWLYDRSRWPQ